ncbi:MAG: STAS domain-containing protein [Gammaproteobacteria bacterium]|nr:STAS domain-containing protein [Gammaproteobacteria bacterium]
MNNVQAIDRSQIFYDLPKVHTETIGIPKEFSVVEAVPFMNEFKLICQREVIKRPGIVILNFSKTNFLDSSGIGALASIVKMSKVAGIILSAKGLTPQIEALLVLTKMDEFLKVDRRISQHDISMNNEQIKLPVTHASIRSRSKRVIDVLGALVGLTITGLLFIPVAIAIRSDGGGTLFFSQNRCGWMGTKFKLWKFRSMVTDAEARKSEVKNEASGAIFKAKNDPRITRVGRFLRRSSIDELPQFWNVLQGSMSLVGTRPPTEDEIDQYEIPEWRRFDVKPGITGEWQVNGRSSINNFEDVIHLDLRYQRNWSILYDIKLLFRTITVVFSKKSGAM